MPISLSVDDIFQQCLSSDPQHNPRRAQKKARILFHDLCEMEREWNQSEERFHNGNSLVYFGSGTNVTLRELLTVPAVELDEVEESNSELVSFW